MNARSNTVLKKITRNTKQNNENKKLQSHLEKLSVVEFSQNKHQQCNTSLDNLTLPQDQDAMDIYKEQAAFEVLDFGLSTIENFHNIKAVKPVSSQQNISTSDDVSSEAGPLQKPLWQAQVTSENNLERESYLPPLNVKRKSSVPNVPKMNQPTRYYRKRLTTSKILEPIKSYATPQPRKMSKEGEITSKKSTKILANPFAINLLKPKRPIRAEFATEKTSLLQSEYFLAHLRPALGPKFLSVEKLAQFLLKLATSDMEKAWAIFLWITQNIEFSREDEMAKATESTAKQVLQDMKGSSLKICTLFVELAKIMELEAEIIKGNAKFGYNTIKPHYWIAIKLYDDWRLVDPCLGAGKSEKKSDESTLDTFWFLPHPEQAIYTIFPEKETWQLLKQTVSYQQFLSMLFVKPLFFKYNISTSQDSEIITKTNKFFLLNENKTIASVSEAVLQLKLTTDKDVEIKAAIRRPDSSQSIACFVQNFKNETSITSLFPSPDLYLLEIFGRRHYHVSGFEKLVTIPIKADFESEVANKLPRKTNEFDLYRAYLVTPMARDFEKGDRVFFQLKFDNPVSFVAVKCFSEETLQPLKKNAEDSSFWEGEILCEDIPVSVTVKQTKTSKFKNILIYE